MPKKRLTNRDGEVRELTKEDFAAMQPFKEMFPELHASWKKSRGRPPKEQPKHRLTVRVDADIVAWLKQQGAGYQTRINAILREAMKQK